MILTRIQTAAQFNSQNQTSVLSKAVIAQAESIFDRASADVPYSQIGRTVRVFAFFPLRRGALDYSTIEIVTEGGGNFAHNIAPYRTEMGCGLAATIVIGDYETRPTMPMRRD